MNSNSQIHALFDKAKTVAVIGGQFGDEGKGKFGDVFAKWANVIARGTGGANAGHTISIKNKEHVFHLIPSGILYDWDGKINIIGSGTAFDPGVVREELALLRKEGVSYNHLLFSKDAHLVLPQHLVMDRMLEQCEGKIGTTGRGIGPVYQDHYARMGLRLNDLFNKDIFARKLAANLRDKRRFLTTFDPEVVKNVFQHEHLLKGRFWKSGEIFDTDAIIETYWDHAGELERFVTDTDDFLRRSHGKMNILLEGAQANLLSIDYGTYPHVTASDCTLRGLTKGVGLHEGQVDLALSVVKAFYMTRVGDGPLPTEIGGSASAGWVTSSVDDKKVNRDLEFKKFGQLSVNDPDEFRQGVAIRMAGHEYGATTGRPRRTGWLDLPLLRYSLGLASPHVILTKLDVLDECKEIKICTEYEYIGDAYRYGKDYVYYGSRFSIAPVDSHLFANCIPRYQTFPGWEEPIGHMREYKELPTALHNIIDFVRQKAGIIPRIISVGPDREQTIVLQ